MAGRVSIVTGPTSGIGRATALGLARLGATVVLACRDVQKGEATRQEILSHGEDTEVGVQRLDLGSFNSIRSFVASFGARHAKLHVLVNNAGIFTRDRRLTEDGLESQFQVNYLGHFLLTHLLMNTLKGGAPSRIVNVSSEAHRGARIEFDNLRGDRAYSGYRAYGQSKLAQILFTHELARRLEGTGVTVNALHPGVIRTNLGTGEYPRAFNLVRLFFKRPERGARTSIHVATSPALERVTGKYFKDSAEARSSNASHDPDAERRLWDASLHLAGLSAPGRAPKATPSGAATGPARSSG